MSYAIRPKPDQGPCSDKKPRFLCVWQLPAIGNHAIEQGFLRKSTGGGAVPGPQRRNRELHAH